MLKVKIIVIFCWIFIIVFNFLLFFVIYYDKENMFCLEVWLSLGYGKVNFISWFVVVGIILVIIMIFLYVRVVYDLWFKKLNGNV